MPGDVITVVLEEGFSGEHVVARIASRTVYENSEVTTKLMSGMAASFEVDRETALEHGIVFELPERGVRRPVAVGAQTAAVRVSLADGAMDIKESTQIPGYM